MKAEPRGHGRTVRWLAIAVIALGTMAAVVRPVAAEPLPDVTITVVAAVHDTAGWLLMHQEVLRTPPDADRPLFLTLPSATSGSRTVRVNDPRFSVKIASSATGPLVELGVTGRLTGAEALSTLPPFEAAILEVQAGAVKNELTLTFGLSLIVTEHVEVYLSRP